MVLCLKQGMRLYISVSPEDLSLLIPECYAQFPVSGLVLTLTWIKYEEREERRLLVGVINFKFPLQPHQKYYITHYEELGLS